MPYDDQSRIAVVASIFDTISGLAISEPIYLGALLLGATVMADLGLVSRL